MTGKLREEAYELRFVEGVFFHEITERFYRIIEYYVVGSLAYHYIEEGTVLIPGEYSFSVGKRILFHDSLQEKIDILDHSLSPFFVC